MHSADTTTSLPVPARGSRWGHLTAPWCQQYNRSDPYLQVRTSMYCLRVSATASCRARVPKDRRDPRQSMPCKVLVASAATEDFARKPLFIDASGSATQEVSATWPIHPYCPLIFLSALYAASRTRRSRSRSAWVKAGIAAGPTCPSASAAACRTSSWLS